MNRSSIAIVVAVSMALMTVPGQVTAHDSTATDLNAQAYDNVWPLIGPGGVFSQALSDANDSVSQADLSLPRAAERTGGAPVSDSCTHHDDGVWGDQDSDPDPDPDLNTCDDGDVNQLVAYQCTGPPGWSSPLSNADITLASPMAFNHSDLDNGIIEATGSFFVNFTISGDDAHKVDQLWFGFLHTWAWPASSSLCERPFPLPGGYYEFYRGDTDGSDGWEIPINTLLVPDAPYGSLVRAIDSAGNTLAVGFSYANVNNYLNDLQWNPGTPTACNQEDSTGEALCPYHDTTPPRASVFKHSDRVDDINNADGTGSTCAASASDTVSLEYGEPLATTDGGQLAIEITDDADGTSVDYTTFNAPDRDVDSVPIETTARDNWGPGFCIENAPASFTVKAWDQGGNVGTQHITT